MWIGADPGLLALPANVRKTTSGIGPHQSGANTKPEGPQDPNKVPDIFVGVNSGGTTLTYCDLLLPWPPISGKISMPASRFATSSTISADSPRASNSCLPPIPELTANPRAPDQISNTIGTLERNETFRCLPFAR